jgi:hypothetical protein
MFNSAEPRPVSGGVVRQSGLVMAVFTSGVLLLRHHPLGDATTTAAGQLAWLALTCLPILVTPFVANARGHQPG